MKRKFNKLFILLVMVMALFINITPLNATITQKSAQASIIVNGLVDNSKVYIYKVLNGVFDAQGNLINYKWDDNVRDIISHDYASYIDKEGFITPDFQVITSNDKDLKVDVMANLANKLAKHISSQPSIIKDSLLSQNGSVKFEKKDIGSYVIYIESEDASNVYRPIFVNIAPSEDVNNSVKVDDKIINVKKEEVYLTKDVDYKDVYHGQKVTFTLSFNIPQYIDSNENKKVEIKDTLPSGLSLDTNSIKIYLKNDINKTKLNEFRIDNIQNNTFVAKLNDYDSLDNKLIQNGIREVIIEYSATVNENAYTKESLTNKAAYSFNALQHSNLEKTINKELTLNIYELIVNKEAWSSNKTDKTPINPKGTAFELYKQGSNEALKFKKINGKYFYSEVEGVNKLEVILNSNDEFKASIDVVGLPSGKYTLKEVVAPLKYGFAVPQNPNTEFNFEYQNGNLMNNGVQGTNVKKDSVNLSGQTLSFTIENFKGEFNIPNTGGVGTTLFTVGGILIMATSMIAILMALKKRHN